MRWPAATRPDAGTGSARPDAGRALRLRSVLAAALPRLDPRGLGAGQGIVEYGLILSLSALLAVVLLVFFGGTLSAALQVVGDAIDAAT
jgi:Flp pilus assembly pilin Flp